MPVLGINIRKRLEMIEAVEKIKTDKNTATVDRLAEMMNCGYFEIDASGESLLVGKKAPSEMRPRLSRVAELLTTALQRKSLVEWTDEELDAGMEAYKLAGGKNQ